MEVPKITPGRKRVWTDNAERQRAYRRRKANVITETGNDMSELDPHGKSAHDKGSKLDAGKPLPHLVLGSFSRALEAVTEVGTFGARKYTPKGWCSVPDGESRYAEAGMRHYLKRGKGEARDLDSGMLHLAHQAWNVLAELELHLIALEEQSRK